MLVQGFDARDRGIASPREFTIRLGNLRQGSEEQAVADVAQGGYGGLAGEGIHVIDSINEGRHGI